MAIITTNTDVDRTRVAFRRIVRGAKLECLRFEGGGGQSMVAIESTKCLEVRLQDARTQSDRRRLGSVTLTRSRVRVRAGYEFVSCWCHGDQRLIGPVTGPIATSLKVIWQPKFPGGGG